MASKNGSGAQLWPLKSTSGENPAVTQGRPITFECNDVPDRAPTGPLAYYLVALLLTVAGTLVEPEGGSDVSIPRDVLPGLLIDSIDWTNSFFGTPISGNYVKGTNLPIVEFVAGGFQYGQRQTNQIDETVGGAFSMTLAIPACNDKRGRLVKDTSNLALLFRPSHFKVNFAAASVLDGYSEDTTVSGLNCRVSAVIVPRPELVLGTPMEWVLTEIKSGGNAVKINGFGRDTALTGVESKGGVATLGELTLVNRLGGIITPNKFTQISFQWRGQGELQDIQGYQNMINDQLPNDRPQVAATTARGTAGINDYVGFPYSQNNTMFASSSTPDLDFLLIWLWVLGGDDLQLTDLQSAETDETYYITQTDGFEDGDHLILGQFAREFQEKKRAAWLSTITDGGASSLASYVLQGPAAVDAAIKRGRVGGLTQRYPRDKHSITADQFTYLPWQLA